MRRAVFVIPLLLAPGGARADWVRTGGGVQGAYLTALAAPDARLVFSGGVTIDASQLLAPLRTKVAASSDGGRAFRDISGTLDDTGGRDAVDAVFFLDAMTGWVASGEDVSRTRDGGTTWITRSTGARIRAIHFFDAARGVLAGEGGAVLTTEDGGDSFQMRAPVTRVNLQHVFFADAQRGWAVGHDTRVEMTEDGEETYEMGGAVIRTSDGGATWTAGATFDGLGLGPVFMTQDGLHGYLAAFRRTTPSDFASEAILFATSDGGATFRDLRLPLAVGTLMSRFGDAELKASRFFAMYWDDAQRGRLAGAAHVISHTSGTSNGMMSTTRQSAVWRIVDYTTEDGGATWARTDLGTIVMQGLTPPPSDGTFYAGVLVDRCTGWLAGDENVVYAFETDGCTGAPPADGGPSSNTDGGPGADAGPGTDGATTARDASSASSGGTRERDEGCACSAGDRRGDTIAFLLVLLGFRGVRRRARHA